MSGSKSSSRMADCLPSPDANNASARPMLHAAMRRRRLRPLQRSKVGRMPRAMADSDPSPRRRSADSLPLPDCVALVLQGGGALGSFQAGVIEALGEARIEIDWVAG